MLPVSCSPALKTLLLLFPPPSPSILPQHWRLPAFLGMDSKAIRLQMGRHFCAKKYLPSSPLCHLFHPHTESKERNLFRKATFSRGEKSTASVIPCQSKQMREKAALTGRGTFALLLLHQISALS